MHQSLACSIDSVSPYGAHLRLILAALALQRPLSPVRGAPRDCPISTLIRQGLVTTETNLHVCEHVR